MSRLNMAVAVCSLVPMVLFIGATLPHVRPSAWTDTTGIYNCSADHSNQSRFADDDWYTGGGLCRMPVDWPGLLGYSMWFVAPLPLHAASARVFRADMPNVRDATCMAVSHNCSDWLLPVPTPHRLWAGFFNIGTLAGQVMDPQRVFPRALLLLIPAIFLQTTIPMALALSVDPDLSNYEPGNFTAIARSVAGPWLETIILVGAVVTQLGLVNGAGLVADEALQTFLLQHADWFRPKRRGPFLAWCAHRRLCAAVTRGRALDSEQRIAPVVAVFNGTLLALLLWVDFDMLIVSGMLIFNVTVVLLMVAYVVLKRRHPELNWMYGTSPVVAALLATPPAVASVAMTVMDIADDETLFGVPHVHLVVFVVLVSLGVAAQCAARACQSTCRRSAGSDERAPLIQHSA